MADHLVQNATAGIGRLLSYLDIVQGDVEEARAFLKLLGWDLPPGLDDIGLAALDLGDFFTKLDAVLGASDAEWNDDLAMAGRIADLALAIEALTRQIHDLAQTLPARLAAFGDYVERTQIHKELPRRLFDFLVANFLAQASPLSYAVLHLLNIIDYPYYAADPTTFQVEHVRATINYHLFKVAITSPDELFTEAYGWHTPDFQSMTFLTRLSQLLQTLGLRSRIQPLSPLAQEAWLGRAGSSSNPPPQLITFLHEERGAAFGVRLGLSLFGAAPTSAGVSDAGLGLAPIIQGRADGTVPFPRLEDTRIEWSGDVAVLKRLAVILRPGQDLTLRKGAGIADALNGRFTLGLRHGQSTSEFKPLVRLPGGSALRYQQFSVAGGLDASSATRMDTFVELALLGLRFDLSLADADNFIQGAVGQSVQAPFDLTLRWSSREGLSFSGSGGLHVALPLQQAIGPLKLDAAHIGIDVGEEGIDTETSVNARLVLGPVTATVERIGVTVALSFQEGNLGLFGLSPSFKPPTGLGLAITTPGVTGGGFLGFDPQRAEYSGMVQLELAETLAIKALGLLTTTLPDGSRGYSLIVILTADGFAPIPVGLGFTLTGIGGLVALHRTVRTDVLREGLKTGTLNAILFPPDPLRNAPQIFSDLRRVFPPTAGRHVVGPMVQLRWGSPTLLTLDLALLVELPAPIRVVVLGRLQVLLPNQTHPLVQIRMDALGVLDLSAETVSLDATLYDSRILQFTLTGDMALRAGWGRQPQFVLAIGGFHPRFAPPPGLPALQRLALQLADGDSLQLRCQAYLAVTSNTVQFGARVDLHAAGGGFSFDGMLGFDAILQLAPVAFEVAVGAALALRYHGRLLMGISFKGRLAGPTPWHVEGKASIKLLFFSVSVHFARTFGSKTAPPLPAAVDVIGLIAAALADRRNWSGAVPRSSAPVVTIRETPPPANGLRVHPWAELTVRERIAPLNRPITKLGTAPLIGGPTTVTVSLTDRAGAQPWRTTPVTEPFALAQYEDLREDEQLAQPSFVPLDGGLTVAADDLAVDDEAGLTAPIAYETVLLDPTRPPERPKPGYVLSAAVLARVARFGAAGQAPARKRRRGKTAVLIER
ncbi:MAG: hypothetical protein GDA65_18300 [Nitrospira sp. CR1.1]|nr:hypothetical protein [Nitrospira sp. CR1.1]